jgi:3-keto-disaccharide hydrolase
MHPRLRTRWWISLRTTLPAILAFITPPLAGQSAPESPHNRLTAEERHDGWQLLFDGKTTAGWRGFKQKGVPKGWVVEDGSLVRRAGGADLITLRSYRNFELALEWKISSGGNSGIMYRVTEDGEATYETGPEMQVLDDAKHPDGASRLTSAGACFGLYPAPAGVVHPAGEWNAVRIVVNGNQVEHWLNDVKVVEYELLSPDWESRVAASKFSQWKGYGRAPGGHIALQDHGDDVAYRSIRLRELP